MKLIAIIDQLKSLRENSQSFMAEDDADPIWQMDVEALDAAIKIIIEYGRSFHRKGAKKWYMKKH